MNAGCSRTSYSRVYLSTRLLVYLFTRSFPRFRFQKAGDAQHAAGVDQALGEDPEDAVVNRAHRRQEQTHQGEGNAGDEQTDSGDFLQFVVCHQTKI